MNPAGKGRRAFTLIELLLAASILALVITTVGAVLAAGVRTWQTARDHLRLEAGGLPGLVIWERDVMNAEPFHGAGDEGRPAAGGFHGGTDTMILPVSVVVPGNDPREEPGFVRYRFDERRRAVMRDSWLLHESPPELAEPWIENVDSLRIRYVRAEASEQRASPRTPEAGMPSWQDPLELPAAVSITLELSAGGVSDRKLRRTIVLPRGARG